MLAISPPIPLTPMSFLDAIGRVFRHLWPKAKLLVDGDEAKHPGISDRLMALVKETTREALKTMQSEVTTLRDLVESQKRQIRRLKRMLAKQEEINRIKRHELSNSAQKLQSKCDEQGQEIAELKKINYDQQIEINRLLGLLGLPIVHRPMPPQLPGPAASLDDSTGENI